LRSTIPSIVYGHHGAHSNIVLMHAATAFMPRLYHSDCLSDICGLSEASDGTARKIRCTPAVPRARRVHLLRLEEETTVAAVNPRHTPPGAASTGMLARHGSESWPGLLRNWWPDFGPRYRARGCCQRPVSPPKGSGPLRDRAAKRRMPKNKCDSMAAFSGVIRLYD
jgi:hypothetical protein